jgi:hypothetical protein
MPTADVCEAYDSLASNIIYLLDLKKQAEKHENEAKLLEARKLALEKGETPIPTLGSTASSLGAVPSAIDGKKVRRLSSCGILGHLTNPLYQLKKRPLNSPAVARESKRSRQQ